MTHRLLADALVGLHLAFIVFVVAGGLLALKWRWVAAVHLPSVAWGAWTEFTGTICPLTPWENALRRAAGEAGYAGSFVDQYLVPVIYPAALTPALQFVYGTVVIAINAAVYGWVWRQRRRSTEPRSAVR